VTNIVALGASLPPPRLAVPVPQSFYPAGRAARAEALVYLQNKGSMPIGIALPENDVTP
jgi:hypothetical protein